MKESVRGDMLALLAAFVAVEAAFALLLSTKLPPLYRLARRSIDLLKTSKGASILLTVFATLVFMLASSLSHIHKLKKKLRNYEKTQQFDQHSLNNHSQEACLIALSLFLGVVILRLHSYLREIQYLQLQLQISRKQAEAAEAEYLRAMSETKSSKQKARVEEAEVRSLTDVIIDLRLKLERLQIHSFDKDRQITEAEATVKSLQKQTMGFLLEYDRIVAENENLRGQLSSLDRMKHYSRLDSRKIF